jgi:anthranilate synthase component I
MQPSRAGFAHPLFKVLQGAADPLRLFNGLLNGGDSPRAFLLESADSHSRNAVASIGSADPCLLLSGKDGNWEITALAFRGEPFLAACRPALTGLGLESEDAGKDGPRQLRGRLPRPAHGLEESKRLLATGPMDLLRVLQGSFELTGYRGGFPAGGLFGAFSYDFIDYFEELPRQEAGPQESPDYHFVLADRLFQVDHLHGRSTIIGTVFGASDDPAACPGYHETQEWIRHCAELATGAPALPPLPPPPALDPDEVITDQDDAIYQQVVRDMKEHILAGDVFQIVPSRSFTAPLREAPLDLYRRLRELNPSPYMFYLRMGESTLLGASPETALKVSNQGDGTRVEIRPIAGTKPRGLRDGKLDQDLDSRYEAELKLDAKELSEHVMLVDLARNDVARVCKAASRRADQLFVVEKYSHVQHLVSRISGELRDGLDPLHAYLATMNMGTLTGAPKVEAMRLLRLAEKSRRGFYGGAVGYYMFDGDFDTAIVIRSLQVHGDRAVARAGAGVVYDSIPTREADETRQKAGAPLAALGLNTGVTGEEAS